MPRGADVLTAAVRANRYALLRDGEGTMADSLFELGHRIGGTRGEPVTKVARLMAGERTLPRGPRSAVELAAGLVKGLGYLVQRYDDRALGSADLHPVLADADLLLLGADPSVSARIGKLGAIAVPAGLSASGERRGVLLVAEVARLGPALVVASRLDAVLGNQASPDEDEADAED